MKAILIATALMLATMAHAGIEEDRLYELSGDTWRFAYYMCGDYRSVMWNFGKKPRPSAGELVLDCTDYYYNPGFLTVEDERFVLKADIEGQRHEFRFSVHGEQAQGTYRLREAIPETGIVITYPEIPMEGILFYKTQGE